MLFSVFANEKFKSDDSKNNFYVRFIITKQNQDVCRRNKNDSFHNYSVDF